MTNGKREFQADVVFVDRQRRITFTAQTPVSAWKWITNWAVAQRESDSKPPLSITLHELDDAA